MIIKKLLIKKIFYLSLLLCQNKIQKQIQNKKKKDWKNKKAKIDKLNVIKKKYISINSSNHYIINYMKNNNTNNSNNIILINNISEKTIIQLFIKKNI